MTATPTEVALKYQKKQPRPMLQDAAHNQNNKIAIGALIYVKAQCPFLRAPIANRRPTTHSLRIFLWEFLDLFSCY